MLQMKVNNNFFFGRSSQSCKRLNISEQGHQLSPLTLFLENYTLFQASGYNSTFRLSELRKDECALISSNLKWGNESRTDLMLVGQLYK